jgi:hypothetical protein
MAEYMHRLIKAIDKGSIPKACLAEVQVMHEDLCGIFRNAPCNCDVDMSVTVDGKKYFIDEEGEKHERV